MFKTGWLDGRFVETDLPLITLDDRSMHFGDGVFETVYVRNGQPLFLSEHFQRLEQGCSVLNLDCGISEQEAAMVIEELARMNESTTMLAKIIIWRSGSADSLSPQGTAGRIAVVCRRMPDYPQDIYKHGVKIVLFRIDRSSISHIKSLCYLTSVLAKARATESNAFEAVFTSLSGLIEEASASNVIMIENDVLVVPQHDGHILDGVTQKAAISVAEDIGVQVRRQAVDEERFLAADEIMLTNTSGGIIPVTSVDTQIVGNGSPGPITLKLISAYEELVKKVLS